MKNLAKITIPGGLLHFVSAQTLRKREQLREVRDGFYLILGNIIWYILHYMAPLKPIRTKVTHNAK